MLFAKAGVSESQAVWLGMKFFLRIKNPLDLAGFEVEKLCQLVSI